MKLRHSKHLIVVALAAVAIVILAGDLVQASNMGFKMNRAISNRGPGQGYPVGYELVSLPFRNPYITAQDLCVALTLPGTPGNRATVTQYDVSALGTPISWSCGDAGTPPTLKLRLGVEVISPVAAGGIIVGSHQPGIAHYPIVSRTAGYPTGENLVTIPYHGTAANLADLCTQIGLPNGANVTRYAPPNGTPNSWTCGDAGTPPVMVLGFAVEVLMTGTPTKSTFVPPHF